MDVSTIAGSGPTVRSLVKEAEVAASPVEVWSAWTSNDGIASWWGPAASNIELRIGGSYEILFSLDPQEGERGSEGKILAAKFARQRQVPYFGICFGMQMACIEAAHPFRHEADNRL